MTKIAGTYDYKLYRDRRYNKDVLPNEVDTYTYLGSSIATVSQTGAANVQITTPNFTTRAYYAPDEGTAVPANGPNYQFLTDLADRGMAHFYVSGDSLLLTQYTHEGHGYTTVDYYRGVRRP